MTEARLGGCGPVNVRAGPHLGGGPDFEGRLRPCRPAPVGAFRPPPAPAGAISVFSAGGRPPCAPRAWRGLRPPIAPPRGDAADGGRRFARPRGGWGWSPVVAVAGTAKTAAPRAAAGVKHLGLRWQAARRARRLARWLGLEICCRRERVVQGLDAPGISVGGPLLWEVRS